MSATIHLRRIAHGLHPLRRNPRTLTCRPSAITSPCARPSISLRHARLPPHAPLTYVRAFTSTSNLREEEDSQTTFSDPSRSELFYHLVPPPTPLSRTHPVFAVSLLPHAPPRPDSSTVLGWLPAETPGNEDQAGLNDFKENPAFRPLLDRAIASALVDGVDEIQINGAIQIGDGWMHIHDARNIPPLGRIGDPDDILGTVRVEEGKILASTYSPMPAYRVCTSDGVSQLTDGLAQRLREVLEARAREERIKSS
ncbi:hypothetical protein FA95DRAFT_1555789 [Auriscalpium vulgare]|uniref:Uncharacterized protein n=1 Tax=Auriscalpium vulgare TaxID=40419 RepID=A0ACB8S323_9AGAM|nr:hypothetical protein FA95DRAFT_1555789 [Auriscalpium vulgare]